MHNAEITQSKYLTLVGKKIKMLFTNNLKPQMCFGYLKNIALTLVILQLLGVIILFVYGGRYLDAHGDEPIKADAIVVLGGATGDRLTVGLMLWKNGYADTILLTGSPEESSKYYSDWREYVLINNGVLPENIMKETSADSSWKEAIIIKNIADSHKWNRVLIVSDPPHTRRLMMIYKGVFRSTSYDYHFIKTSPKWWNAEKWWENTVSGAFVIMEYVKIVYYLAGFSVEHGY